MNNSKNEAKRVKAGLALAKKLEAAGDAMAAFISACRDLGEPLKGLDDSRLTLSALMREYQFYLEDRYDKESTD